MFSSLFLLSLVTTFHTFYLKEVLNLLRFTCISETATSEAPSIFVEVLFSCDLLDYAISENETIGASFFVLFCLVFLLWWIVENMNVNQRMYVNLNQSAKFSV